MTDTKLVKSSEVAEYFSVTSQTIYLWRKNGKIPPHCYTKVGNTYRYDLDRIQEHFDPSTTKPEQYELFDLTPGGDDTHE